MESVLRGIASIRHLPESAYRYPPCVYFLVDNGVVVYVGQSIAMLQRAESHHQNPGKVFDDVFCLPVETDRLDLVEGAFIRLLKPKYNGRTKTGKMCAGGRQELDGEVLASFGVEVEHVVELPPEPPKKSVRFFGPDNRKSRKTARA